MPAASTPSDHQLWQLVLGGDTSAFEQVVTRHQAAVSAVSYSRVGDFSASEDLSQEVFLVAWQARDTLEDARRLRGWLCGIARNLANNYLRRKDRRRQHAESYSEHSPSQPAEREVESEAESLAIAAEEQALVWDTLQSISETYREPLVLFYRDGQSVSGIAEALDISTDAARQRLSRGRSLLRDSVAKLVGQTLEQSRPGRKFTATVMAALGTASISNQAVAGTTSATAAVGGVSKLATTAAAGGLWGGLLGAAGGLAGGWFGTWLPAQLAPTMTERKLLEEHGKRAMRTSFLFTGWILLLTLLFMVPGGWIAYVALLTLSISLFVTSTIISSRRLNHLVQQIRQRDQKNEAPNTSPLRSAAEKYGRRLAGRTYRSKVTLLGMPLLDIQVGDPPTAGSTATNPLTAHGWIAIGDRANGILVGMGGFARGFLAFGGVACGGISVGGVAFGAIAFGGLGIGLLSFGGLALGIVAAGGGALGWQAAGGCALAWQCACGGAAMAYEAAMGGAAIAKHYAVGGAAIAEHANDEVARRFIDRQVAKHMLDALQHRNWLLYLVVGVPCLLSPILCSLMYRRRTGEELAEDPFEDLR